MSKDPCDPLFNNDPQPELQLVSVAEEPETDAGRRWFSQVVTRMTRPMGPGKPNWVHLPDRVWQRQSALLVSLRQRKRHH